MNTATLEGLGDNTGAFREMSFSIEKVTVEAKTRAEKPEYSLELAQDLKAIHGLDAETELANILSTEVLAEINREVVRTIYTVAKPGAQNNVANAGSFDLDVDSNGRWSVEKFKGLIYQIERDANAIAKRLVEERVTSSSALLTLFLALNMLVYLITPLHFLLRVLLTTPSPPLLVFLTVVSRSTLILTLLTSQTITTTSWVIRVLLLMMQVSSTAHMFLSKWFVPSVRTPSNLRSSLRLVTVWLLTHSLVAPLSRPALTANDNVYYRRTRVLNLM